MNTISESIPADGSSAFLNKWFGFLAVVVVLLTTVFGWFFPNTWSIVLLLACRLFYGKPLENIKTAFSNPLFLAYFIFFAIEAAGYLHTNDFTEQGKVTSKEATLIVIAFVFCAGRFADRQAYKRLVTAYCLILLVASIYCLVMAMRRYEVNKDLWEFFYHLLTAPLSQNAVFFSVYMLFGIIFLLSSCGQPEISFLSDRWRTVLRYTLLFFFLGMMVMLSSRLMLALTPLILLNIIYRRFSLRWRKLALVVAGCLVVLAVTLIATSKNFVRWRFVEMTQGNMSVVHQQKFDPSTAFSSWDLRLLQWRFALQILNTNHGWVFGVSPGNSQNLLDQKYIDANMFIGDPKEGPHRHIRGFLGYNFHNQFIETLVRSGLVGLAALVAIFVLCYRQAKRSGIREVWFVMLVLTAFFCVEAPLTIQHGVFLFCFFPLMAVNLPPKKARPADNSRLNTNLRRK